MADAVLLPDKTGAMTVVTVIKVTYCFSDKGTPWISENQMPICYGDEYWGEPGQSSLRYATDLVYKKNCTDIAVNGQAYTPTGKPVNKINVSVAVGSHKKIITVLGDRVWTSTLGIITRTRPLPFREMPIRYERAFGGKDTFHKNKSKHGICKENPVGVGFRLSKSNGPIKGMALPNIEHASNQIKTAKDTPKPAGFGFIAPSWEPRQSYAGTYNDTWRKERMPLPPPDFDTRFNNAAAPDLMTKKVLTGKETVTLTNLHPAWATVSFTLPGLSFISAYTFEHQTFKPRPMPDTLIIEPDENRFILVFRSHYTGPYPWTQLKQVTIHEEKTDART